MTVDKTWCGCVATRRDRALALSWACSMCGPKFCPMQMTHNLGDLSFIEQAPKET
jgi:hypothetical protein